MKGCLMMEYAIGEAYRVCHQLLHLALLAPEEGTNGSHVQDTVHA